VICNREKLVQQRSCLQFELPRPLRAVNLQFYGHIRPDFRIAEGLTGDGRPVFQRFRGEILSDDSAMFAESGISADDHLLGS
jgi:hypothetical protein